MCGLCVAAFWLRSICVLAAFWPCHRCIPVAKGRRAGHARWQQSKRVPIAVQLYLTSSRIYAVIRCCLLTQGGKRLWLGWRVPCSLMCGLMCVLMCGFMCALMCRFMCVFICGKNERIRNEVVRNEVRIHSFVADSHAACQSTRPASRPPSRRSFLSSIQEVALVAIAKLGFPFAQTEELFPGEIRT